MFRGRNQTSSLGLHSKKKKKEKRKLIFIDKCFCGMLGEKWHVHNLKYMQSQFTEQEDSLMN